MTVREVVVVGAGTMGAGIAQVCAQSGIKVFLGDISQEKLETALANIDWSVSKFVEKGVLLENKNKILARIKKCDDLSLTKEVDLAIEAVFEDLQQKRKILSELDEICPPHAIIASNTSTLPITELAETVKHPERILGLPFFNPPPIMAVVEVIKGMHSSKETLQKGIGFVKQVGKEPIEVNTDMPGFLLNRINLISYVEAIRLVELNVGTVEDIDKGIRLGFGRKMGPFETGDLVGLDVSYNGLMAIYQDSKDVRYYPPLLLRRKVKAGHLGRKTGRGWYSYC